MPVAAISRLGEAAKMPFSIHPHMLCHAFHLGVTVFVIISFRDSENKLSMIWPLS